MTDPTLKEAQQQRGAMERELLDAITKFEQRFGCTVRAVMLAHRSPVIGDATDTLRTMEVQAEVYL